MAVRRPEDVLLVIVGGMAGLTAVLWAGGVMSALVCGHPVPQGHPAVTLVSAMKLTRAAERIASPLPCAFANRSPVRRFACLADHERRRRAVTGTLGPACRAAEIPDVNPICVQTSICRDGVQRWRFAGRKTSCWCSSAAWPA